MGCFKCGGRLLSISEARYLLFRCQRHPPQGVAGRGMEHGVLARHSLEIDVVEPRPGEKLRILADHIGVVELAAIEVMACMRPV